MLFMWTPGGRRGAPLGRPRTPGPLRFFLHTISLTIIYRYC